PPASTTLFPYTTLFRSGELRGLSQRLREGEHCLEAAARKIALIVQLSGIGDPFIDEDQAGAVLDEKLAQHITGTRRLLVILRNRSEEHTSELQSRENLV